MARSSKSRGYAPWYWKSQWTEAECEHHQGLRNILKNKHDSVVLLVQHMTPSSQINSIQYNKLDVVNLENTQRIKLFTNILTHTAMQLQKILSSWRHYVEWLPLPLTNTVIFCIIFWDYYHNFKIHNFDWPIFKNWSHCIFAQNATDVTWNPMLNIAFVNYTAQSAQDCVAISQISETSQIMQSNLITTMQDSPLSSNTFILTRNWSLETKFSTCQKYWKLSFKL